MTTPMTGNKIYVEMSSGGEYIFSALEANLEIPCTVWVKPGAGSTVNVFISYNNGIDYVAWPYGPVTVFSSDDRLAGITHIKYQQTVVGADSTGGVC